MKLLIITTVFILKLALSVIVTVAYITILLTIIIYFKTLQFITHYRYFKRYIHGLGYIKKSTMNDKRQLFYLYSLFSTFVFNN